MARSPKAIVPRECEQPALFLVPEEPELVPVAKTWQHNAKTTLKDEQRCYTACELLCRGVGVTRVAEHPEVRMSRHTVRAIRAELRAGGKLAPWKEEIVRGWKDLLTDAKDALHEFMDAGLVGPHELSVLTGILADKVAAAEGQAGLIVEHRHEHRVSVEKVQAFWATVDAGESQSTDVVDISPKKALTEASGASLGVGFGLVLPGKEAQPGVGEGGGGDRVLPAVPAEADVSPSAEFQTKVHSEANPI